MTPTNDDKTAASPLLRFGDFTLDTERRVLEGPARIELPDLSYRLLLALLRRAPEQVSKDDLIREVWDGAVVSDETLAQRVKLLRQVLGDDSKNPRYIAAVRGRGYRMLCSVRTGEKRRSIGLLAAALVATALGGLWLYLSQDGEPTGDQPIQSLAVLPFQDLSAGEARQYFADGMQEELLARLTKLDGIEVVSRTSVERFRDTNDSIVEIAATLGADAIIEGSARIESGRVRITVQLIDGDTDRHLWADTFDSELTVTNVFAIQEEVAGEVAAALSVQNRGGTLSGIPTDSLAAYNSYLLGRFHTFNQTPDDLARAITHLQAATEEDPGFAEAWAVLGWAWSFQGTNYGSSRPVDVFPRAKDAALKALSLDSDLGNAHSLYGDILTWYDWDFPAAERSYRRAMEVDPLDVLGYALFLSIQDRHSEAIQLIERRLQAHPDEAYVQVNAAWRFLGAGLTEEALASARMADGHPDAEAAAGATLLQTGELEEAVGTFRLAIARHGRTHSRVANLASALYRNGEAVEAKRLLDELLGADAYVAPSLIASVLFSAGDIERGFEFLAEAVSQRDRGALFLLTGPVLTDYRDRPEFRELAGAVGVPAIANAPP